MGKSSGYAPASGIKRGPWTPEEDKRLLAYIQLHGHGSWRSLPQKAGTYLWVGFRDCGYCVCTVCKGLNSNLLSSSSFM